MNKTALFSRTELLLGEDAMERISRAKVIVFGVGGVGSWCAEGLVRSGICHLTIVDPDCVGESNVNRQLMATTATIGQPKVEVLKARLQEINPEAEITALQAKFTPETASQFNLEQYDYIIDAIDTLKNKIFLILSATATSATFFSSMGAALKLDPTRVRVTGFWEVRNDPLARMLRKRIRQGKVLPQKDFLCVYSEELMENRGENQGPSSEIDSQKAQINGAAVPVTATFGFTLASLVIKDLC
ncbi:MAG: tRNA threonylcarbamoyladenosine dehydratase [Bacteroidales bacterium]|nr:tRNA threonylcarbamoyladenosine dehydratase [Bacteroidales bacterium]